MITWEKHPKNGFENLPPKNFWETDIQRVLDSGEIDKNGGIRLGLGKAKVKTLKFALYGAISCSGNNMYVEANKTQ